MKVENFKGVKNQFVIFGDDAITFQSYSSAICEIKNGVVTFGVDWDYSKTTSKYLYLFLDEYVYGSIKGEQQKEIINALNSKNKKAYFQKLIDNDIIIINE